MLLCCGEALIDMIPSNTLAGETAYVPHAGGAVFNTSIALGRLGVETGLLSGVSSDLFGQQLLDALGESRVDTSFLIRSERPTTLAFVKLVNGHAEYAFYDENTAGRMMTAAELPALSTEVDALFFGGISLACEPCADAYTALSEKAGRDRVVMVDPNVRPGFASDEGRYRARIQKILALADIVKVSDEDLAWLMPDETDLMNQARTLQERGAGIVLITRGSEGAIGLTADGQMVEVAAEKADVVDTVGAGDTFNAGVLADLSAQGLLSKATVAQTGPDELERALAFGARVAAVTVSRSGANPPWAHEL